MRRGEIWTSSLPSSEDPGAPPRSVRDLDQLQPLARNQVEDQYVARSRAVELVLEGGRIRYAGTAQRLKDEPELLRSAYLLRDASAAEPLA